MKNLINYLKKLSNKQFFWLMIFEMYFAVILTSIVGILAISFDYKPILGNMLYVLMVLIAFVSIFLLKATDFAIISLLNDDLNIEKFIAFVNTGYRVVKSNPFLKNAKSNYLFLLVKSLAFQGQFEASLKKLDEIHLEHVFKKFRPNMIVDILCLKLLCKVHLNTDVDLDSFRSRITEFAEWGEKDNLIQTNLAIYDLIYLKKPNPYFKTVKNGNSKLENLVRHYYSGINSLLTNDFESLEYHFTVISKYDERLFMVREARRWLVEMQ
ncbi:hypothetical protein BN1356_01102 [Streptococcus varani]|uniref:Uncharacterized protein n=1 Tax=Streptococcus varani TaxID=1608583 RepID=A0A0E3WF26_9STRE|nr:hypothetical protein [Streptococcus varani]CQR24746.1 hypothetical protein BN1356_01102 [Streptococcus varani]